MKTALIFDIDGTLIDSERIDAELFVRAVKEVCGNVHIADDWTTFTRVTDVGILSEIFERNGREPAAAIISEVRERFRTLLEEFLGSGGTCSPITGITGFLDLVSSNPSVALGIATGGWGTTARMKLAAAGIDIAAIPLSSSDDSDDRSLIMQHCLSRMNGPFGRVVYIGDGVWDRNACEALGWRFIGIGKKLRGKCSVWFEDFGDGKKVLGAVLTG
jgi:beta-phosphoglucomutase-like phosphatase (HAD superfamily)